MNKRTEGSGKPRSGRGRKIRQESHGARDPRPARIAGEAERFWAKTKRAENGCLQWTGALDHKGYPRLRVWRNGRWTHIKAHRWRWEQAHGPLPDGFEADHTCHNDDPDCPAGPCLHRSCVEIDHLEAVLGDENRRRARVRRAS